jgi:hypothetical protein
MDYNRFETEAWEGRIVEYLQSREKVTVGEVARNALLLDTPRIGATVQRRISAVLMHLQWRRDRGSRWWIEPQKKRVRELRELYERKARRELRELDQP